jgi:hypothetical protein
MVNFYNHVPVGTHTVYPDIDPIYLTNPSGSLKVELVQDLDNSTKVIFPTLTNTPNEFTPRLIFNVPSGSLPLNKGQYTMYTYEGIDGVWNQINDQWQLISNEWDQTFLTNERLISTDRAWVEGVNGVTITQYTGTNQTGTYTTYNL